MCRPKAPHRRHICFRRLSGTHTRSSDMMASGVLVLLSLATGVVLGEYGPEFFNNGYHGPGAIKGYYTSISVSPYETFKHIIGVKEPGQCSVWHPKKCNPHERYRSIDGTCNNLLKPSLGAAGTTYSRLLPAKYSGAKAEPALSVTGHPLPPARRVSRVLFPNKPISDERFTLLTMQWGQTVVHDMSRAHGTTQTKPHKTRCCSPDNRLWWRRDDPSCYPILVDEEDPVFGPAGIRCMNFVRSNRDTCSKQATEQLNDVTAFLDLSVLYGSDLHTAKALRLFKDGLLKTGLSRRGRPTLPEAYNSTATCDLVSPHEACYHSGDQRVNQNPQLALLRTLLLREHNRIASTLAQLNPHWDDEKIYQEARRILIAEHQHNVYWEWLPIILGWDAMVRYNVLSAGHGYARDYDPKTDPSVLNEHATAALRYLHTNIQGFISLVTEDRRSYDTLRLSDHYNRPDVIERGDNFDLLVRGLATQPQHCTDRFNTEETTQYLFRNGKKLGQDLCAVDTQRGRDHGLPSYNDVRHYCGLPRAHKWEDLRDLIDLESIEKLSKLYKHPDDVDLAVGGSLEAHVHGALLGPTFLCIIAEQFRRTRRGDRYFYDFESAGFTPVQLKEIRKSNVARLLCDNSDDIKLMQPRPLLKISPDNQLVSCKSLPAVDLRAWKEDKVKWHEGYGGWKDIERPWNDIHSERPKVYGPWQEGYDLWKKDDFTWRESYGEREKTVLPELFVSKKFKEEESEWHDADWPRSEGHEEWNKGGPIWNENPGGRKDTDGKWHEGYGKWPKGNLAWNGEKRDLHRIEGPWVGDLNGWQKGEGLWKDSLGGYKNIEGPLAVGSLGKDGGSEWNYDLGPWLRRYGDSQLEYPGWKGAVEDWKDDDGPWDDEDDDEDDITSNIRIKETVSVIYK